MKAHFPQLDTGTSLNSGGVKLTFVLNQLYYYGVLIPENVLVLKWCSFNRLNLIGQTLVFNCVLN